MCFPRECTSIVHPRIIVVVVVVAVAVEIIILLIITIVGPVDFPQLHLCQTV